MSLDEIDRALRPHLAALGCLGGTVKLDLGDAGTLFLDARNESPSLTRGDGDADCVVSLSEASLRRLMAGELNPLLALGLRKIKIKGDTAVARKLASMLADRWPPPEAETPSTEAAAEAASPSRPASEAARSSPPPKAEQAPAERHAPVAAALPAGNHPTVGTAPRDRRESLILPQHASIPGRLRLRVFGLKGNRARAARLESRLAASEAFTAINVKAATGTVLLRFDPRREVGTVLDQVRETLQGVSGEMTRLAATDPGSRSTGNPGDAGNPRGAGNPGNPGGKGGGGNGNGRRSASRRRATAGANNGGRSAPAWHTMTAEKVLAAVEASRHGGLSADEAARRLKRHGANALPEPEAASQMEMLVGQFASLPVALLGVSAVISVATGGVADAVAIVAVLGINAVLGYFTESQAERTIQSLTGHVDRAATVRRDGTETQIPVPEVVPGDLVMLTSGTFIPADARLISATELTVDESMMTGESHPVRKDADTVCSQDAALGDRINMVYKGTVVTGGGGHGVVVGTGLETEIGNIHSLVGTTQSPETPMQRQLGDLGRLLAVVSGGICVAVLAGGVARGYGFIPMLKASTALAVAAVPEGLPAVATTTLALGMRRMRRNKVLIRRLEAVETLGSLGVICFDKTGTLTVNRMTVSETRLAGGIFRVDPSQPDATPALTPRSSAAGKAEVEAAVGDEFVRALRIAALCNEARFADDGSDEIVGSATEAALLRAAADAGIDIDALHDRYRRVDIERRSEGHNVMVTHHEDADGARLAAMKGAPTEVLARCAWVRRAGERIPLGREDTDRVKADNEEMASEALRVLGIAYRHSDDADATDEDNYTWLGLVGMADPIRPGMRELMREFHQAGLRTVMITGDQSATAYAIARDLKLNPEGAIRILEPAELDHGDPELFAALTRQTDVFARVSPANKLEIVQGLQRGGAVVAMTGDGINDGPALKAADVGVAMGTVGADVAHELADVVLEDDRIETIAGAIAQGRTIYSNIRKSLHFLLATNLSEVVVVSAATSLGMGQPLSPAQLLWINLVSDIFPGIALSLEPPHPEVMRRPPRDPGLPIISRRDLSRMGIESLFISAGALAAYGWGSARYGIGPQASTMAFHSLTVAQLLHALSCRSDSHRLIGGYRFPPNRLLTVSVLTAIAATALTAFFPPARRLLGTAPLGPTDWAVSAAAATLPFLGIEGSKPWLIKVGGEAEEAAESSAASAASVKVEREEA